MEKRVTDDSEARVLDVLTRGVGTFVDPGDVFKKKLIAKAKGEYKKDIIVKFGVDPTRPDIHLGHAAALRKLRQLQDLGCKVIFLVGDFTATIGDPTGKSKVRPEMDQETIGKNVRTYIAQIPKILKIEPEDKKEEDANKGRIVRDSDGFIVDSPWFGWMRNAEWFYGVTDITAEGSSKEARMVQLGSNEGKITVPASSFIGKAAVYENTRMQKVFLKRSRIKNVSLTNIFSVLRLISHAQLIERDMFQERLKSGEPLFMHEMLYPVIQGIDSDVLGEIYGSCDLEMGGTDQTFNMLMGRKVMEMTKKDPQSVLSVELLVGLDGKEKMSKSLDNYVGITDEPNAMFGKIMSVPDSAIVSYFELCTFTPIDEVEEIKKKLKGGKTNPRDIKMDLGEQIVALYHGKLKSEEAKAAFIATFQNKKLPDDMPLAKVARGALLVDVLIDEDIIDSKSEFRRLMGEGAIRKDGEEKLMDPAMKIEESITLRVGKHRFIKIVVE